MDILMSHTWPGNVRELKNLMERLVVLNESGEIEPGDLPAKMVSGGESLARPHFDNLAEGINFNTAVTEYEKALILKALEKTSWVKNKAAELLQIKRTTLVEKIKRYKLKKSN
jgi:DNA-binding NtrC family response regulator